MRTVRELIGEAKKGGAWSELDTVVSVADTAAWRLERTLRNVVTGMSQDVVKNPKYKKFENLASQLSELASKVREAYVDLKDMRKGPTEP